MKRIRIFIAIYFGLLAPYQVLRAQAAPPPNGTQATVQSAGTSSGTYSIEGELLAYQSLKANAYQIALDVKPSLTGKTVVLVPSVSTILPAFQLWRSNMLIAQTYIDQTDSILTLAKQASKRNAQGAADAAKVTGCPANTIEDDLTSTSYPSYAIGIDQGVGVLQTLLSLFTTNQTTAGLQGTVQDQALLVAVAQELRSPDRAINVLAPDIFAPYTIDVAGPFDIKSPYFIGKLTQLVRGVSRLQDYYQCNALIIAVGTQLTQSEQTLEADLTKLSTSSNLSATDLASIVTDINTQAAAIGVLRLKLGLLEDDALVMGAALQLQKDMPVLSTASTPQGTKTDLVNQIIGAESKVIAEENPLEIQAAIAAAKTQSVATGIGAYLSGLTGGAVTVSAASLAPPATTTPTTPAPTASSPGTPASGAATPGSTTTPAAAPAATTAQTPGASSPPPIVTILQADGLARKMLVQPDANGKWGTSDSWLILWVKSMESGSTTDTKSTIFGSTPRINGGAISGYQLFTFDGTLICSGNAGSYGGYIKPEDFAKASKLSVRNLIPLNRGCTSAGDDTATENSKPKQK